MAIVYQNKSEVSVPDEATSITIPVPEGFSVGDLLIACVVKDTYLSITIPAGWTIIQEGAQAVNVYFSVAYRIAEVGDTEWTWTGNSKEWYGVILRYTGQDTITPIYDSNKADGVGTTPTAPSVDYADLEAGSLVLQAFGADDDDTPYTTPVQLTERYNGISSTGIGTCGGAGGDKAVSGTGSTGTAEFTMGAASYWVAVTVVIEAASGVIVKTFQDSGVGTDNLLVNKTLIFPDSGIGVDKWVLPAITYVVFSDSGSGADAFKVDKTLVFSDAGSGIDIFKVDKTVIFSDLGEGVDIFLIDKEAIFKDVATAIDKFRASYPYPRDLKRKIIIIRDIK